MRIRTNFADGNLDASVSDSDTSLSSPGFADLPVVTGGDHIALVLEPESSAPEVVWVTAHTASATTVTVSRGEEGTTAVAHADDSFWTHAPTAKDFPEPTIITLGDAGRIYISATEPPDPQPGDYWFPSVEEFLTSLSAGLTIHAVTHEMDGSDPLDIVATGGNAVYVHDGTTYVKTGGRTFVGPEDPADDGFTLVDGDFWEDTSA